MRPVILESPYSGSNGRTVRQNVAYARQCMADCLARNESPFPSHLLYTQPGVLDDTKPEERRKGMDAGFAWHHAAQATVVYVDYGITGGMIEGMKHANDLKRPIEIRQLFKKGDGQ